MQNAGINPHFDARMFFSKGCLLFPAINKLFKFSFAFIVSINNLISSCFDVILVVFAENDNKNCASNERQHSNNE